MPSMKERKLLELLREHPGKTAHFYHERLGCTHNELISSFDKLSNAGFVIGTYSQSPLTYYLFRDKSQGEILEEQLCTSQ